MNDPIVIRQSCPALKTLLRAGKRIVDAARTQPSPAEQKVGSERAEIIRASYAAGASVRTLATAYECSATTIRDLVRDVARSAAA